jgi:CRISPR system Cascade subunit CasA
MTQTKRKAPSFNLWFEPWIMLEEQGGTLTRHGIRDVLHHAHEYVAIYDSSPLVVVGIHRLLTAVVQDALNPQENADLEDLWQFGRFPPKKIEQFEKRYADRFDLFSPDKPFLQSADLPLFPESKEERKEVTTVARLFSEIPSGTLVTHYHHSTEDEQVYAPATAATGLVVIPPFISSGGPGLMPSINGVPPIYVLPGGKTLFESLASSLIAATLLSQYPPNDVAWWKRPVPVKISESKKKKAGMTARDHRQLAQVGYLQGLTFPARKVRLHPEPLNAACSRSGQFSEWDVRTMTFKMGESVLEEVEWIDPFVAYKLPPAQDTRGKQKAGSALKAKTKKKQAPIRPARFRSPWREFSGLFLLRRDDVRQTRRPLFLDQLAQLQQSQIVATYPFRCVALQTDGKMKFFEWFDFGFDVPPSLLQDPDGALWTESALNFATECAAAIRRVFAASLGNKIKNAERFARLRERMEADFWSLLAGRFRQFVLDLGVRDRQQTMLENWYDMVVREAQSSFDQAADETGDDGRTLRNIVEGKSRCARALGALKQKFLEGG